VEECEKWQKYYFRQLYVLIRHCGFDEAMFWLASPKSVQWKMDLWNEEQEEQKKQYENAQAENKTGKIFTKPGGFNL